MNKLLSAEERDSILSSFEERISGIGFDDLLVFSSKALRVSLLSRDSKIREVFSEFGTTPKLVYIVKCLGRGFQITFKRANYRHSEFCFRFILRDVCSLSSLLEFQSSVFVKLLEESLALNSLEFYNGIIGEAVRSSGGTYSLEFVPDTFSSDYVRFISDSELVLTASSGSLYRLNSLVKDKNLEGSLLSKEIHDLSISQGTVELLYNKSNLVSYLLNSGNIGLKKLLKGVYSKTVNSLKVYKQSKGYAYYLDDNVFGIVKRDEYGTQVVLSPVDITSFTRVDWLDLVREVDG